MAIGRNMFPHYCCNLFYGVSSLLLYSIYYSRTRVRAAVMPNILVGTFFNSRIYLIHGYLVNVHISNKDILISV